MTKAVCGVAQRMLIELSIFALPMVITAEIGRVVAGLLLDEF